MTIDLDAIKAKLAEYDDSVPRCPKKVARTVNYAPDYLTPQHTACTDAVYREYDLTTYSPCCRPEGHEGECRNSRLILGWPGFETVKALVAEVERLREQRVASTANLLKGYETGRAQERALVVAWLRKRERQIENWPPGGMNEVSLTYSIIADEIERGEHRREEEP